MAAANLPAGLHSIIAGCHSSFIKSTFPASFEIRRYPNSRPSSSSSTVGATAASSPSSWEHEEQRWFREEQRWLREEQRWLREELRWSSEREALLREVAALRLRIEALEGERPPLVSAVEAVLVAGKERRLAAEAQTVPLEEAELKEIVHEDIRIHAEKERATLRMGSEGEQVREMQDALLRLGFYSGEDDMEYSSFSSGTERAVKTWQASLGATEDGVMTAELLDKLFVELNLKDSSLKGIADQRENLMSLGMKDGTNGAPVASIRDLREIQETVIKEAGDAEVKVSQHRVFLLGENRWEEPSRLGGRNKPTEATRATTRTQCLTCRGEGRLMCTECDGTGEPNIEPQFLEWIGEGAKCPYCEGLGYIICDICEGKSLVQN